MSSVTGPGPKVKFKGFDFNSDAIQAQTSTLDHGSLIQADGAETSRVHATISAAQPVLSAAAAANTTATTAASTKESAANKMSATKRPSTPRAIKTTVDAAGKLTVSTQTTSKSPNS